MNQQEEESQAIEKSAKDMKLIKEQLSYEHSNLAVIRKANENRRMSPYTLDTGVIWRLGETQCGERVGSLDYMVQGSANF